MSKKGYHFKRFTPCVNRIKGKDSKVDIKVEEVIFKRGMNRVRLFYRISDAKRWKRLGTLLNVTLDKTYVVKRHYLISKIVDFFKRG